MPPSEAAPATENITAAGADQQPASATNPPSNLKASPKIAPSNKDGADIDLMEKPPEMMKDGQNLSLRASIAAHQKGERSSSKLRQIAEAADSAASTESPTGTSEEGTKDETAKGEPEKDEKPAPRPDVMTEKPSDKPSDDPLGKPPASAEVKSDTPEISDAELRQMPAREQKRIKSFIARYASEAEAHKTTSAKLAAVEKELTELKASAGKLPENVQKDLDELTKYRRRYDLENDPEIQTKFTKRIADGEALIMETVKASPLFGPFVENKIKEAGSFNNFIRSKRTYAIQGEKGPEQVTGADIYKRLLDTMPIAESDIIRQTVADQLRTEKEKARYIDEESGKAKEHFAEIEKKNNERQATWTTRVTKTKEAAAAIVKEAFEKLDFLKDEPVPADATKEAKERIGASNTTKATLRNSVKSMFENPVIIHAAAMTDSVEAVQELRDMILDSHRVIAVEAELESAKKQIAKLEGDLKAARGSSRTTTTTGGVPATKAAVADAMSSDRLPGESDLRYSMRTGKRPPMPQSP